MNMVEDADMALYINPLSARGSYAINQGESGNVLGLKDYKYVKHLHYFSMM